MPVINTNITALSAHGTLQKSQSSLATSMERLSSGIRINSAKDDAAGQAIGNRMTSQINGQAMAIRNTNDGVSMSQTAQGALDQINDKLQRIRELTVQGLNGTLTWSDSDSIQNEINMNLKEIDRLATSSDYNGIPLLDGQGGLVNLQVGANTSDTLGVDLLPPGFSVEALGLEDFTVRGIDGEVTPRNTLSGRAFDIELYPQNPNQTRVTYSGVAGSEPTLRQQSAAGGGLNYYISTLDGNGNPRFYDTRTPVANHTTATDRSTVSVASAGLLYTDSLASEPEQEITSLAFNDASGNTLEGSTRLLSSQSGYLIEQTAQNGSVRYYDSMLDFLPGQQVATASAIGSALATKQAYELVSEIEIDGESYVLGGATLVFQGSSMEALTSANVVEKEGSYYIQSQLDGDNVYYRMANMSATPAVEGEEPTLVFQADTTRAFVGADLADRDEVTVLPPIDFSTSPAIDITDNEGSAISGNPRLTREVSTGQYMVEISDGAGRYSYHQASVAFSIEPNGEVQVNAQAQAAAVNTFDLNERVEKVSGSSTITLDPRNVTVNYTDSNGDSFSDVLRQREDGNYYFDLPDSHSSYGNSKVASLVDVDGNNTLIKTVNGTGEVIIYHPLSVAPLSINVTTDANGPNDDGIPHSIVNLTEVDRDIRLRTPPNPLAALDQAISMVDSKRSYLGALENRLGAAIENNLNANINLAAARSRIEDTDYALEASNMVKNQILQQAGTSILAQANQTPQNIITLLK
ncbi:flagellin [Halomonas sp. HNIBRBA4712]|uniref:flagellin N-terminal helical domain-containing protein n=1 Tax=Halomonas sp. HNIBRBA4712 TaxID=3373087 RepID=UPI0037467788